MNFQQNSPTHGQSELPPAKIADVARNLNAGNKSNALAIVENSIMAS